jgi:hypothetical protein
MHVHLKVIYALILQRTAFTYPFKDLSFVLVLSGSDPVCFQKQSPDPNSPQHVKKPYDIFMQRLK